MSLKQLEGCTIEQLSQFTTTDSALDLTDLLMAAGFPHITVSPERRHLAYECCLLYEVITKRIAALDDIRKGLQSVKVMGNTVLVLLSKWPELKGKFFPKAQFGTVNPATLISRIFYVMGDVHANHEVRAFFERYINEVACRDGKLQYIYWLIRFPILYLTWHFVCQFNGQFAL